MDGIEYDAFVAKQSHATAVLVYSTFHSRKNLKLASAELKHLGLKFHAFIACLFVECSQYFAGAANLDPFAGLQ